jgi:hypothetical protein
MLLTGAGKRTEAAHATRSTSDCVWVLQLLILVAVGAVCVMNVPGKQNAVLPCAAITSTVQPLLTAACTA